MMPRKFRDDISNGSEVIVFRDRQPKKHTNRHYWKQYHSRCAGNNNYYCLYDRARWVL